VLEELKNAGWCSISAQKSSFSPRLEILVEAGGIVIGGKGLAELLEEIEKSGSLRKAAAKMNMNYKRAWMKIKMAESKAMIPLVERKRGRRGYSLSSAGREFLEAYRSMEERLRSCGFSV